MGARRMHQLVVLAYANETLSGRAAEEVGRCRDDLELDADAIAVAICERDGRITLTTSSTPGVKDRWSRFWGELVAFVVNETDCGPIDPGFAGWLRSELKPTTSALFVAVPPGRGTEILDMLSPFGGTALIYDLPISPD